MLLNLQENFLEIFWNLNQSPKKMTLRALNISGPKSGVFYFEAPI